MSIVGTLLPEQLTFFTNSQDLADIVDMPDDFYAPFHIYLDGKLVRSRDNISIWDVEELAAEVQKQNPDARLIILDNLGQIAYAIVDKPPTPGQFYLVYAIQSRDCAGLWDFFQDTRSDLVNEDDSGGSCLAISVSQLADTVFDSDDWDGSLDLKGYIENLQQIARLYPLLEIKLYHD